MSAGRQIASSSCGSGATRMPSSAISSADWFPGKRQSVKNPNLFSRKLEDQSGSDDQSLRSERPIHSNRAIGPRFDRRASLLSSTMGGAQIPDLKLPGNLPGQLTEFGVGMRDAIRRKLGTCNRAVDGTILVCGHREQYRIDRNLLEAERNASKSGSSEYEEYLEARARHPNQGN